MNFLKPVCLALIASVTSKIPFLCCYGSVQDYDFDWATIGDVGNPEYFGKNDYHLERLGRGSVDYEYRISTHEVTTAQWIEFANTFATQRDDLFRFAHFNSFGAIIDNSYDGPGRRWRLHPSISDADQYPVTGISWRDAALFVNWLHHNKTSDLSLIQNGAYDASTFGRDESGGWSDQATRNPNAKFWIPNTSEWLKAVHWDPNKNGPDQGGWWQGPYGTDELPTPGMPSEPGAQTSAGLDIPLWDAFSIPLGSYPDQQTPWGLFDASGGTTEMHEGWWDLIIPRSSRPADGAHAGRYPFGLYSDHIEQPVSFAGGTFSSLNTGLRIAGIVPAPGPALLLCGGTALIFRRIRQDETESIP